MGRGLRLIRLEEEVKELQICLSNKDGTIADLEGQLKEYYSPQQYAGLERRCK